MSSFFTSDTHWGHTNILKYANRGVDKGGPFRSIEEHDEALIRNWNAVVQPTDDVFHLGDFAFMQVPETLRILRRLNGNKHLIWGNHDKKLAKDIRFAKAWTWTRDLASIEVDGQRIVLCHYAMRVWDKSHFGAWHLYGHSHGSLPDDPNSLSFDVGVDCWAYTPISFAQVAERMKTKRFVPVDRHGRD
jgi:calcineurin-like phosphoesterase family protein